MNKVQVRMEENEEGKFQFDIQDFIDCMNGESKKRMCNYFVHIADSLERQLKRQADLDSWDTSGLRDCSKLREHILKVQGDVAHYKGDYHRPRL